MDYYGLLFLYYLKGLSGKSVLRLFFNIEAGGTEQLLPENTSTPTTTPILADIQYPDGLRTDQYFTYRETPTTVSNKARIKTIKGNTLVWNQLIDPRTASGTMVGVDYSFADGVVTLNGTATNTLALYVDKNQTLQVIKGHKYYLRGCPSGGSSTTYQIFTTSSSAFPIGYRLNDTGNGGIQTAMENEAVTIQVYGYMDIVFNNTKFYPQLFDLTAMGLASLTDAEILQWFADYFSLPYYAYNQGSLLSFMGNGIKTVGANQWHNPFTGKSINSANGEIITTGNNDWMADKIFIGEDKNLYAYLENKYAYAGSINIAMYGSSGYLGFTNVFQTSQIQTPIRRVISLNQNTKYVIPFGYMGGGATSITDVEMTLANIDINEYVPYTSSTLSLPVSTYFPTGMKSAGNVYDELLPTKAITRIGAVDLGSLNWTKVSGYSEYRALFADNPNLDIKHLGNILCAYYETLTTAETYRGNNRGISIGQLYISVGDSTFTNLNAFASAMSGVYLYYELATPTETPITTEDANEALSLLMGKSVSSNNANQLINIITKGE